MKLWVPSPSYATDVSPEQLSPAACPVSLCHLRAALRFGLPVPLCLLPRQSNQSFRGPASLSSLPVGTSAAMAGGRLHPEAQTAVLPLCLKIPAQLVLMFCPCLSRPGSCVLKHWPTLVPRPVLGDSREHTYRFPCVGEEKA